MSQNKYKTKLKKEMAEALLQVICRVLEYNIPADDDDKLLFATLDEIRRKLDVKLLDYNQSYNLTFSPAQAFALRILSTSYVLDYTSYLGNKLLKISNEVHQQFSKI